MGEWISLTATDGYQFSAWKQEPVAAPPKGGLVLIQEAFGVNDHIRDVARRFADLGYLVIAPAMYDRYERGFEVGYSEDEIARGISLLRRVDWGKALLDVEAARDALSKLLNDDSAGGSKIGVVGYCFGGSLAWMASCCSSFDAAVAYYGSRIPSMADEVPRCPIIAHFGRMDKGIPLEQVEKLMKTHPEIPVYLYDAGHGFSCDKRASFSSAAHDLAWKRTVDFFQEALT